MWNNVHIAVQFMGMTLCSYKSVYTIQISPLNSCFPDTCPGKWIHWFITCLMRTQEMFPTLRSEACRNKSESYGRYPVPQTPIRSWSMLSVKLCRAKPPWGCSRILSDQCFSCFIWSAWSGIKMKDPGPFRLWEYLEVHVAGPAKQTGIWSKTSRIALGNRVRTVGMWFEQRELRGSSSCRAKAREWIDP